MAGRVVRLSTTVVAMQNGVEVVERLTLYVHGAEVIPTVAYGGAELLAPGHIRHSSNGCLIVDDTLTGQELAEMFSGSIAEIRISVDFVTDAWRKLGINRVANGITALTSRLMEVLNAPGMRDVATRILHEGWTASCQISTRLGVQRWNPDQDGPIHEPSVSSLAPVPTGRTGFPDRRGTPPPHRSRSGRPRRPFRRVDGPSRLPS